MVNSINIEIITPLNLVLSKKTKMSVIPAQEGEVGIMYKHSPLMTILNRGIVKLYDDNSISDKIAIDGGVVDVSEKGIVVLTERAELLGVTSISKQILSEKVSTLKNNSKIREGDLTSNKNDEIDFLNYVMDNL